MKKYLVAILHEWQTGRSCYGKQIDYALCYASTATVAKKRAEKHYCEMEHDNAYYEAFTRYSVLFCEELSAEKKRALLSGYYATPDWYPLDDVYETLNFGTPINEPGYSQEFARFFAKLREN